MFLDKLKETLEPLSATCSMCLHCFSEITIHNPGSCNNTTAAYLLKLEGIGEARGYACLFGSENVGRRWSMMWMLTLMNLLGIVFNQACRLGHLQAVPL